MIANPLQSMTPIDLIPIDFDGTVDCNAAFFRHYPLVWRSGWVIDLALDFFAVLSKCTCWKQHHLWRQLSHWQQYKLSHQVSQIIPFTSPYVPHYINLHHLCLIRTGFLKSTFNIQTHLCWHCSVLELSGSCISISVKLNVWKTKQRNTRHWPF